MADVVEVYDESTDSGHPVYSMMSNRLVSDQEQKNIEHIDYDNCSVEQFEVIVYEWRQIPSLTEVIATQKESLIKSTNRAKGVAYDHKRKVKCLHQVLENSESSMKKQMIAVQDRLNVVTFQQDYHVFDPASKCELSSNRKGSTRPRATGDKMAGSHNCVLYKNKLVDGVEDPFNPQCQWPHVPQATNYCYCSHKGMEATGDELFLHEQCLLVHQQAKRLKLAHDNKKEEETSDGPNIHESFTEVVTHASNPKGMEETQCPSQNSSGVYGQLSDDEEDFCLDGLDAFEGQGAVFLSEAANYKYA